MTQQQLRDALKQLKERQEALGKQLQELQKGLKELGMQPSPVLERPSAKWAMPAKRWTRDVAIRHSKVRAQCTERSSAGRPEHDEPDDAGDAPGPGTIGRRAARPAGPGLWSGQWPRDPLGRQLQEGNNTGDGIEQNGPKVPELSTPSARVKFWKRSGKSLVASS